MITILRNFGRSANSPELESLFSELNTLHRPSLPDDEEDVYHDWVLVRRKGIELGFADSEYHTGAEKRRWGYGELLLTQVYFYAAFDDVQSYTGELPYGLTFADSRTVAREKLNAFEATRHSYRTDTWDVEGYRLTITYRDDYQSIYRMACYVLSAPLKPDRVYAPPSLASIQQNFGLSVNDNHLQSLWDSAFGVEQVEEVLEDREADLTGSLGVELYFANLQELKLTRAVNKGLVFSAIKFFRSRDRESVGWLGGLPHGLSFDNSPEQLLAKLPAPVKHSDSTLTGHALWHFADHSLHVLYSNFDNRLLRINLMAPGYWKEFDRLDID